MRSSLGFLVVPLLGLVACGNDAETTPEPTPTARATWFQDVAPILAKHCMACHTNGGIAPFPLTDYDSAVENSLRMVDYIEKGLMPPFDAREETGDDGCTPRFGWVDDPRVSSADKNTINEWIADGYERGTQAEIPAVPSITLPGVTRTLAPVQGFATSGTKDQFVCFVLDPGNTTTQVQWLTGLQVRPGNELVVHHAVITQVRNEGPTPGAADALVDQRGIGIPFACDDQATPGDFIVNIWTPGNQPLETSAEVAVPIMPRSKFVMQIHYHPAGLTSDIDFTKIDLRISNVWPQKMYFVTAFGNAVAAPQLEAGPGERGTPRFLIPANAAEHTEKMAVTIPDLGGIAEVQLFSANPHMHLVGTHISSKVIRPAARGTQPKEECLANGGWNFDWQRTYVYDAPIAELPTLRPGDRIEVSCKWNNTIANPFVQRMLHDAGLPMIPIDITLGEQTTNEMCLEIFGILLDAPAQARLQTSALELPDLGAIPQLFRD